MEADGGGGGAPVNVEILHYNDSTNVTEYIYPDTGCV